MIGSTLCRILGVTWFWHILWGPKNVYHASHHVKTAFIFLALTRSNAWGSSSSMNATMSSLLYTSNSDERALNSLLWYRDGSDRNDSIDTWFEPWKKNHGECVIARNSIVIEGSEITMFPAATFILVTLPMSLRLGLPSMLISKSSR